MTADEIDELLKVTLREGETIDRLVRHGSTQFKDAAEEDSVRAYLAARSGLQDFLSKVWPSVVDLWKIESKGGTDYVLIYELDGKALLFNLGNKCRKIIC